MKTHGVYWNIAGAGFIVELPLHHGQLELAQLVACASKQLFSCRKQFPEWSPSWCSTPLAFSEEEAKRLATEWSTLGNGRYEARRL